MLKNFSEHQEQLERAIQASSKKDILFLFEGMHPADVADLLEQLSTEERKTLFGLIGYKGMGRVLAHLPDEQIELDIEALPPSGKALLLNQLPDDELVDIFQHLDQGEREKLLPLLSEEKRVQVRKLLHYSERSAGGRMTTAFAAIPETLTVDAVKAILKKDLERLEILSRIFVVDRQSRLIGKVRLRDLTFSEGHTLISEISDDDQTSIFAENSQEEAANLIAHYNLVALPVVNQNGVLLGIITHDDAVDILQQESTEDMEKIMAISSSQSEANYLETGVLAHFRRRVGWVVSLAALGLISGYIIFSAHNLLSHYFILTIYMPTLVAAGGNTGAQAATLVIRAMSLGELSPQQFFSVIWKEVRIGILLGGVLAVAVSAKIFLFTESSELPENVKIWTIILTVGLAFVLQIVTSTSIGALLPILAKASRLDPAVVASPAITTFVDVSGLLIYFSLARLIIGA